eukprot:COSAG06_NODE_54_length_27948_cov_234.398671_20_plen_61_part_00
MTDKIGPQGQGARDRQAHGSRCISLSGSWRSGCSLWREPAAVGAQGSGGMWWRCASRRRS